MNKPLHMLLLCIHALVPIGIVGLQGDYGTAIVFVFIFVFMICSAKISWKYLVAGPFVAAAGIAAMWFFALDEFHKKRKFHAGKRCRVYHFHAAFGRRLGNNGQLQRC